MFRLSQSTSTNTRYCSNIGLEFEILRIHGSGRHPVTSQEHFRMLRTAFLALRACMGHWAGIIAAKEKTRMTLYQMFGIFLCTVGCNAHVRRADSRITTIHAFRGVLDVCIPIIFVNHPITRLIQKDWGKMKALCGRSWYNRRNTLTSFLLLRCLETVV